MCSMMEVDPDKRPSIQQVKEHKWMQLPTACQSEVKDYYYQIYSNKKDEGFDCDYEKDEKRQEQYFDLVEQNDQQDEISEKVDMWKEAWDNLETNEDSEIDDKIGLDAERSNSAG